MTVEKVIEMIDEVFSDMSCSKQETQNKLETLLEHVQACLAALDVM